MVADWLACFGDARPETRKKGMRGEGIGAERGSIGNARLCEGETSGTDGGSIFSPSEYHSVLLYCCGCGAYMYSVGDSFRPHNLFEKPFF